MKFYIGIDLGGTNVRTLLVDENGKKYSEVKDSTEASKGPDYVFDKICGQIDTLDLSYSIHADRKAHRLGNVARIYNIK